MNGLLHESFNHDALSDGFIFTVCSKYMWGLVHSYLIGWGLIWFPALGESGSRVVMLWLSSVTHCHWLTVSLSLFSAVCHDAVEGNRRDSTGSDPEQRISYWGWEEVHCVHVSWVLMYLCCVWGQVIITTVGVLFPFLVSWAQALMSYSPVKMKCLSLSVYQELIYQPKAVCAAFT